MSGDPFDEGAARYDAWYDTPRGRELFADEVACLAPLLPLASPRLEVGVGSGRFAAALGVECGIDPARGAVALAARRGVRVVVGRAEDLPFAANRFAAVLFVLTLCFVADPARALREAHRVLAPSGHLVVATVPGDSELGEHYQDLGRTGHEFYSRAHFIRVDELESLLEAAGFDLVAARSALVSPGGGASPGSAGVVPGAGFVALSAVRRHGRSGGGE